MALKKSIMLVKPAGLKWGKLCFLLNSFEGIIYLLSKHLKTYLMSCRSYLFMKREESKRKQSGTRLKEARDRGDITYDSATGCKNCTETIRYVSTRSCVACTKAKNHQRKLSQIKEEPSLLEHHIINVLPKDSWMLEYCSAF